MPTIPICIRIDLDLDADLVAEAKRRGQEKPDLIRTFLRDGLARYDSASEQILQTQITLLQNVKRLQEMVGATLHLEVEQAVLALQKGADESANQYAARLRDVYRETVFEALNKGARIATASPVTSASKRVNNDH
jgi:hypothetical protein